MSPVHFTCLIGLGTQMIEPSHPYCKTHQPHVIRQLSSCMLVLNQGSVFMYVYLFKWCLLNLIIIVEYWNNYVIKKNLMQPKLKKKNTAQFSQIGTLPYQPSSRVFAWLYWFTHEDLDCIYLAEKHIYNNLKRNSGNKAHLLLSLTLHSDKCLCRIISTRVACFTLVFPRLIPVDVCKLTNDSHWTDSSLHLCPCYR